jgi:small subunit ribosomal protein S9
VRRGADAVSSLAANPYGWPQSARAAREAPLWMLLEAEREEAPLASALARKVVAPRDLRTIVLDAPALDARGRAYATGRRKTSVARVWVAAGDGAFTVNGRALASHFERLTLRQAAILPLVTTQSAGAFDVCATVRGGGLSGQAGAVKLGVARALARFDPFLKPVLRRFGQIQRDPRAVERKKPGRPKARKRCVPSRRRHVGRAPRALTLVSRGAPPFAPLAPPPGPPAASSGSSGRDACCVLMQRCAPLRLLFRRRRARAQPLPPPPTRLRPQRPRPSPRPAPPMRRRRAAQPRARAAAGPLARSSSAAQAYHQRPRRRHRRRRRRHGRRRHCSPRRPARARAPRRPPRPHRCRPRR